MIRGSAARAGRVARRVPTAYPSVRLNRRVQAPNDSVFRVSTSALLTLEIHRMDDRARQLPQVNHVLAAGLATAIAIVAGAVATVGLGLVMAAVGLKRSLAGVAGALRHRPAALVPAEPAPREQG